MNETYNMNGNPGHFGDRGFFMCNLKRGVSVMARTYGWKSKRVTFIVSDDYHKIHLVGDKMPIQSTMDDTAHPVYTGPVHTAWERVVERHPERPELAGYG